LEVSVVERLMNDELGGFGRKQSWPNKSNAGLNHESKS